MTESGKVLAARFSEAIMEMKKDGTLQKILQVSDEWMQALPQR